MTDQCAGADHDLAMWESYQWHGVRWYFVPDTQVSSTTYNLLVTTWSKYCRKGDDNWLSIPLHSNYTTLLVQYIMWKIASSLTAAVRHFTWRVLGDWSNASAIVAVRSSAVRAVPCVFLWASPTSRVCGAFPFGFPARPYWNAQLNSYMTSW